MDWPASGSLAKRLALFFLFVAAINGHAATFALEAGSILLREDERRASFNVTNTGNEPILLVSKVENLKDGDIANRILLTPPITRIEPRQSQLIHYVLRDGEALQEEHMLAASFEAIPLQSQNKAKINIKHIIPLMAYPTSIAPTDEPWRDLIAQYEDGSLEIKNRGAHVVRLLPDIYAEPNDANILLRSSYLMPGETVRQKIAEQPERLRITPMNRRGTTLRPTHIAIHDLNKE